MQRPKIMVRVLDQWCQNRGPAQRQNADRTIRQEPMFSSRDILQSRESTKGQEENQTNTE